MSEEKNSFLDRHQSLVVFIFLTVIVAIIFLQTKSFQYVNLDDGMYFRENSYVLSGLNMDTLRWAFTTFYASNWHPLTWISLALDVQLFGQDAGMIHMTSVVLHLINSFLIYLVFDRMTGRFWPSLILAALFAAHPAHVESVAWISERKDVLSTMFWLLTMLVYIKCTRSGSITASKYFYFVLILFALGLMAKPMLVTLPFVLLLCDYWPLNRIKSLNFTAVLPYIVEKVPLFLLSVGSSIMTVYAQRSGGAIVSIDLLPFSTRLANSLVSYAKYIAMMFYPTELGVWYPYEKNIPGWQVAVSFVLVAGISIVCIYLARKQKYLVFGWLWFIGTLVPVIGLVQVGAQALADRYTYIPYIGLFVMAVWGLSDIVDKLKLNAMVFRGVSAAAIAVFVGASHVQAAYWINGEVLFKRTLSVTNGNYLIQHNLCDHLMNEKRLDEAETYCRASLESKPDYFPAYNTLGMIAVARGQFDTAESDFLETVRLVPGYALVYANLASVQIRLGKLDEAEGNLLKAAANSSGSVDPVIFTRSLGDLAAAYEQRDDFQKASEALTRLVNLKPDDATARMRLGFSFYKVGKFSDAQSQVDQVLNRDPNNPFALDLSGLILMGQNNNEQAIARFEAALRIKPDLEDAKQNLRKVKGEK